MLVAPNLRETIEKAVVGNALGADRQSFRIWRIDMNGKTVLVVDDSPTELRVTSSILKNGGYEVVTAKDGAEAFSKLQSANPRLVVLDVVLPDTNGFQICRKLKNSEETSGIKVLMLTCKSGKSDRFWGMKQGADIYMTKPFEDDEFLSNVAKLV